MHFFSSLIARYFQKNGSNEFLLSKEMEPLRVEVMTTFGLERSSKKSGNFANENASKAFFNFFFSNKCIPFINPATIIENFVVYDPSPLRERGTNRNPRTLRRFYRNARGWNRSSVHFENHGTWPPLSTHSSTDPPLPGGWTSKMYLSPPLLHRDRWTNSPTMAALVSRS